MPESQTAVFPEPRARVRAMKEYHPPLGCRDAMRLDFNENTVACSPAVREVLSRIAAGDLTRYPERAPIEAKVARLLALAPEQVALTNGVDEAIHVLFEAFLEPADELLLPVPTYSMYEVYASATDATVIAIQSGDDLQFPFERLAIVLVDEAYFHFHGETVLDLVGVQPNLVVARTFSKAYGLAGLRVGVAAGSVEVMQWIRRVLSPYSVNSVALACLPAALDDAAYINWYVGEVVAARVEFEAALDQAEVRWWPSAANFVLVEIGAKHAEFVRRMHAAGVLVRDRSNDPGCDGRVRITVGTREQMRHAAAAMREAVADIRSQGGE